MPPARASNFLRAIVMFTGLAPLLLGADTPATTDGGARVVLHDDGTWSPASEAPTLAPEPVARATVSVAKCEDFDDYISVQLSLRNDGPDTLDQVHIKYRYIDRSGALVTGSEWYFSDVRAGKTVVDRTMAVRHLRCSDLSRVELSSATCRLGVSSDEVECLDGVTVAVGAVKLTK